MRGKMPSRIIRESCTTSPTLDSLSDGAERLFWRMTTIADDFGRMEADARIVRAKCFPLKTDSIKLQVVEKYVKEMTLVGLLTVYEVENKRYAFFPKWDKHQRVRAKVSKFPPPSSDNICCQVLSNAPVFGGMESRTGTGTGTGGERLADVESVIGFLNKKLTKKYQVSTKGELTEGAKFISARLDEGRTIQDCKMVIANRIFKWKDDPKMKEYLTPNTIFSKANFDKYYGGLNWEEDSVEPGKEVSFDGLSRL